MTCIKCGEPAAWIRTTQFSGDHPYCTKHAEAESDFGSGDSYKYWYEVKYWTISFPGEHGQHVVETWSEDQIIKSYYIYWSSRMIMADKEEELSRERCIEDWCTVHWAVRTDAWGNKL